MSTATSQPSEAQPTGTTYGQLDGFNYGDRFQFNDTFPRPTAYVVVHDMAYFRGPDKHLWFAPDAGAEHPGVIDWRSPQNVAEFDDRQGEPDTEDQQYLALIKEICAAVDAVDGTTGRSATWDGKRWE